jgi:hypothetical protein
MTPSYAVRRSDPDLATGYEDESKRASSSSSRRAKRKSPAYKASSSSSPISSRPSPEEEERGLESHLSSTSASFADSTARRRRPISIASSEGAGSGGKSLRLARAAPSVPFARQPGGEKGSLVSLAPDQIVPAWTSGMGSPGGEVSCGGLRHGDGVCPVNPHQVDLKKGALPVGNEGDLLAVGRP